MSLIRAFLETQYPRKANENLKAYSGNIVGVTLIQVQSEITLKNHI